MATKHRLSSDPELAHAHEAGSSVTLMQALEHSRLGTVMYVWPRHWVLHYKAAHAAYEEMEHLHADLAALPVGADSMRTVSDIDFIGRIYKAGSCLLSEVVRTVQHLCEEIERCTGTPIEGSTIEARLTSAISAAGLDDPRSSSGYSAFQEIRKKRDAIEHPKPENTYNGGDTTWDEVPLAWFMSERVIETYNAYLDWYNDLVEAWETTRANRPSRPTTLDVEMRGLRSQRQFKKPPR